MLLDYEGYIFDLDGTIYVDDTVIPDAAETINRLISSGKKVIFISNKTTGTSKDYYNFLRKNGFNINAEDIITAADVICAYLSANYKKERFFAIGEKKIINQITEAGLLYSENPQEIKIVVVTLDRKLNYTKLEIAAKALEKGARFYAANIDDTCPVEDGEILDAGSTISALEKRTHKKLLKHFGKPSENMIEFVKKKITIPLDRCLIIGDRLETDITMGNVFGIDTALVNTGVKNIFGIKSKIKPTHRINSVADLY
ncbi:MAG: HAD-IIA family hydrolase [Ignavibacteria bacterium]|nr:HAD-IIA family hydrolase [Ignavibacteria bacterium]